MYVLGLLESLSKHLEKAHIVAKQIHMDAQGLIGALPKHLEIAKQKRVGATHPESKVIPSKITHLLV